MKRNYFMLAAASMFLLSACSNDEDITKGLENEGAVQELVLQVASSGDGLVTRAGRPLNSSEANQTIENVKIIICQNTAIKYVKDIVNWNTTGSAVYSTQSHGRQTTIEIPKNNKLAAGTYTVYAFGYHSTTDYNLSPITTIKDGATTGTFNINTTLSFKTDAKNTIGEEIFAGSLSLSVTDGKGFKEPIVLNRQVAGTFGYVKDIPYITDAAKLRLIASAKNKKLILGNFANFDLTSNGTNTNNVKYVINGAEAETTNKVIYEIALSDWFVSIKDEDNNGLIDANTNWKGTAEKYANGSVFAGEFLIPFTKTNDQTFTLQLTKADGSVLRSWNVNLPSGDGQLSLYSASTWGGNDFTSADVTDTQNTYNVVRNHLYGIGKRTLDNPTNPGTDPDVPESLNTKQEITLRVNDNWEVIHNMDIE